MTATQIAAGAGLRHVRVYTLDTAGYPDGSQSGSDGYAGIRLEGVKQFQANVPDVTPIRHTGDDRVFGQDFLPPTELETATLISGKTNLTFDAVVASQSVRTLGDLQIGGFGTDKQGSEVDLCVIGWRQAINAQDGASAQGARQYITAIYCSSRMTPKGGQMAEQQADENSYNLTPTVVSKAPWGESFSEANNGFTEALKLMIISDNPIMMERYTGNAAIVNFLTDYLPISVAKTHAFVDGTEVTVSSVDTTTGYVTLDAAPGSSTKVVILYEASNIV